jgi:hypothetical protein
VLRDRLSRIGSANVFTEILAFAEKAVGSLGYISSGVDDVRPIREASDPSIEAWPSIPFNVQVRLLVADCLAYFGVELFAEIVFNPKVVRENVHGDLPLRPRHARR